MNLITITHIYLSNKVLSCEKKKKPKDWGNKGVIMYKCCTASTEMGEQGKLEK